MILAYVGLVGLLLMGVLLAVMKTWRKQSAMNDQNNAGPATTGMKVKKQIRSKKKKSALKPKTSAQRIRPSKGIHPGSSEQKNDRVDRPIRSDVGQRSSEVDTASSANRADGSSAPAPNPPKSDPPATVVSVNSRCFADELNEKYKAVPYPKRSSEEEVGNVEYKYKIDPASSERFEQLVSQLVFRLGEGKGECIYIIGIMDDGEPRGTTPDVLAQSLEQLQRIAENVHANARVVQVRDGAESGCRVAEVVVAKLLDGQKFTEVRIAIVGNVDVGKSTLLGVLSKGGLDNGRGLARLNVFKHRHEMETGQTSDVGREIVGLDGMGKVVNYSSVRTPTWSEICENSKKVLLFIDLAGHSKYLKTTVFGMTGNFPDYCMFMVAANKGIIGMTSEHYHLTLAMRIPAFFIITKIDMCPENIMEHTVKTLNKMLKAAGSRKMPTLVKTEDDAVAVARRFTHERIAPIFHISNVTGEGLDLLRLFLSLLAPGKNWSELVTKPALFYVDNTFLVQGVGTVVSGTLVQGSIQVGDNLMHGPDKTGKFVSVTIKGIHTNRLPVRTVIAGQSASLALKKVKRSNTRKGQVLASPDFNVRATREFEAEVLVISKSTITINLNYEAVIHCGCTRQTATVVGLEGVLRSNCRGKVHFRYKYRPEFLQEGARIVFREGNTKGIGVITKLLHEGCT